MSQPRRSAPAAREGAARGGAEPIVAVLERHGRFLTAEAFFSRGRRMNVDRPKQSLRAGPGDLVLVAPSGPRAGHGRVLRRIGRPDVARAGRRDQHEVARPGVQALLGPVDVHPPPAGEEGLCGEEAPAGLEHGDDRLGAAPGGPLAGARGRRLAARLTHVDSRATVLTATSS
ncbi:MAG TPA: hypothetical protein VK631_05165, partial [Solirubrobacteraceae bacterium]|nr:hypothetical protein [Solirubrobacteraceae bacterium]